MSGHRNRVPVRTGIFFGRLSFEESGWVWRSEKPPLRERTLSWSGNIN